MKLLHIDTSGRKQGSVTRKLGKQLATNLAGEAGEIVYRDFSQGLPYVDDLVISSYFTAPDSRSGSRREAIAVSDQIVAEVKAADILVLGVPIYNFSMPAALKAWADQLARVGETFKYTENGPVGLLNGKRAFIVVASGGTEVGSDIDFLTPWLTHFLRFIGILDVTVISADAMGSDAEAVLAKAEQQIAAAA